MSCRFISKRAESRQFVKNSFVLEPIKNFINIVSHILTTSRGKEFHLLFVTRFISILFIYIILNGFCTVHSVLALSQPSDPYQTINHAYISLHSSLCWHVYRLFPSASLFSMSILPDPSIPLYSLNLSIFLQFSLV